MNKTPPPLPPQKPEKTVPAPGSGPNLRLGPPIQDTSRAIRRPPFLHLVGAVGLITAELWLMYQSTSVDTISHFFGAGLGMFGSVILMGAFRQALNGRRSSGAFSEWSGPIESTKAMWFLVLVSWGVGTWHLWLAMYEALRP